MKDRLHRRAAQESAARRLERAMEVAEGAREPRDVIEAEITEPVPEPLFAPEDGFPDASRKLIARKRLEGYEGAS
jgi:hypothetical protein